MPMDYMEDNRDETKFVTLGATSSVVNPSFQLKGHKKGLQHMLSFAGGHCLVSFLRLQFIF